ncbi:hypothetical protein VCHC81A2_3781, partial [Vibrio cholerae HC-81A2]
MGRNRVF